MRFFAASLLMCLSACTQFPELDAWDPGDPNAPYPDLLPLSELLGPEAEVTQPEQRGAIESRVSGLRQRAAALRGSVVGQPDIQRMQTGVTPNG